METSKRLWIPPQPSILTPADFNLSPKEEAFIAESRDSLLDIQKKCQKYSPTEYFCIVAREGLRALERGNYGVGAAYIIRENGDEIIVVSHNQAWSKADSSAHAEHELINTVESIDNGYDTYSDRILVRRNAPDDKCVRILIAGIEPCITCVGKIANHGVVDELWIGQAEPDSGALLDGRSQKLPSRWQDDLEDIHIILQDQSIDPGLNKMLYDMFADYRSDVWLRLHTRKKSRMSHFMENASRLFQNRLVESLLMSK